MFPAPKEKRPTIGISTGALLSLITSTFIVIGIHGIVFTSLVDNLISRAKAGSEKNSIQQTKAQDLFFIASSSLLNRVGGEYSHRDSAY
jgi:hypothetical protein